MVSQRCFSVNSSTFSSPPEADRMVEAELEAAEALTDLAFSGTIVSETGRDSGGKWGSKGKRAVKRVKTESATVVDSSVNAVDSALRCSTIRFEDQAIAGQQQCEDLCLNVVMKQIKGEREVDLLRPCSTSCSSFGGGRSRQNLTEAEKEARRMRRILANRESARQTIRRRQALCEDLTKKAADLSWENLSLNKEKELALKEYRSLEITNRNLKERVAQATKPELEETQGDAPPLLSCNRPPFNSLFWPAIVQANASQSQPGDQITETELSDKQESIININGSRTPVYLLPFPWFTPLPDHRNGVQTRPFFGAMNKQDENDEYSASNQDSICASSKNAPIVEINSPLFFTKATDHSSTEGKPIYDLNEPFVGYSQNGIQSEFTVNGTEAVSPQSCRIVSSLVEMNQEDDVHGTRLTSAVTATEARRRRNELTKLKNLHGRQCRMNC